jgi:hypothetical protein
MPKTLDEQPTGAVPPPSAPESPVSDIFSDVPPPAPEGTPIPAETLAQLANYRAIKEMAERGEFKDFRGEYVVVLNGELIAHDADGEAVLKRVNERYGEAAMLVAVQYVH